MALVLLVVCGAPLALTALAADRQVVAAAPDSGPVPVPAIVAVCETCHRADAAVIPVIHGRPAAAIAAALRAFPADPSATVMQRMAAGLSSEEIAEVARAFAAAPGQ